MQKVLVELQSVTVDIPLRGVPVIESSQDRRLYVKNGKLWIRALENVSLKIFAGDRIGVIVIIAAVFVLVAAPSDCHMGAACAKKFPL